MSKPLSSQESSNDYVLVRLTRPEGYEDVHPELILQDANINPAFEPELVATSPADLHWLADKAILAARRDQRDRTPETMAAAVQARTLLLAALGVDVPQGQEKDRG